MQERGEHVPPEEAMEVARKVKENFGYTCADILKVRGEVVFDWFSFHVGIFYNLLCNQEFSKHDKDPKKYRKIWNVVNQKAGTEHCCDVGYERFLAPEVRHLFFLPPPVHRAIANLSFNCSCHPPSIL